MSGYDGEQRRREVRHTLDVYCPAVFDIDGERVLSTLRDISDHGCSCRAASADLYPRLEPGARVNGQVWVSSSILSCSGRVVWTRPIDGLPSWGIAFDARAGELRHGFSPA